MKQQSTPPEIRLAISNICLTYGFSLQTLHNTISILMNDKLPEMANQDMDVCIAALHISQKLHEKFPVALEKLCIGQAQSKIVLSMEILILKQLNFKVAFPLLIDICLQIANQWDMFIHSLTCIDVKFFQNPHSQVFESRFSEKNTSSSQIQEDYFTGFVRYPSFAYNNMIETCQKLMYRRQSESFDKKKLGLAIVSLCIKQAERYHERMQEQSRKIKYKTGKVSHKSTIFIISDFMSEIYGIQSQENLKEEIKFVKKYNFGLKDVSSKFHNISIISSKNLSNLEKKEGRSLNHSNRSLKTHKKAINKQNCQ